MAAPWRVASCYFALLSSTLVWQPFKSMSMRLRSSKFTNRAISKAGHATRSSFQTSGASGRDDILDLSPLFLLGMRRPDETKGNSYQHGGIWYRCCCMKGYSSCAIADLSIRNPCDDKPSIVHRDSCKCTLGSGHESFEKQGPCLVPASSAVRVLKMTEQSLRQAVAEASVTRYVDDWLVTYDQCSTSCGHGFRGKISVAHASLNSSQAPGSIEDAIPCTETSGCQWNCLRSASQPCGFGTVRCLDADGNLGQACDIKAEREAGFLDGDSFAKTNCFQNCPQGQELSTLCAITSNHLDKQYGSVSALVDKTCLSDSSGRPTLQKPQMIILLTQELNRFGRRSSENVFPTYVSEDALAGTGYIRAATCEGKLSANSAVFIREDQQHHVLSTDVECSGTTLRTDPCDWTNCKGSTVMGLTTSAGRVVIGNWHGARAGTISSTRVTEFEKAAEAIMKVQPFLGRKHIVWGGDTNVRLDYGPEGSQPLNLDVEQTPEQIWAALGPDVLGIAGKTVNQHLKGKVGFNSSVKSGLEALSLKQVKGWKTICPTKTKATTEAFDKEVDVWRGEYYPKVFGVKVKKWRKERQRFPNLRCRSPPDQMSIEDGRVEYLDMEKLRGDKPNPPSLTERFFLSPTLFDHCGKAMKDVRNRQDDHDALYVRCALPAF